MMAMLSTQILTQQWKFDMPRLIVFSGIPCSGKSSARKEFTTPSAGSFWTVISRDDIRDGAWGKTYKYTTENEKAVTRYANNKFEFAVLMGWDIIVDNTHCKESYLDEWVKKCPKNYELKIVFFPINFYLACFRNVVRRIKTGKWIPWDIMFAMKKNFDRINQKKYALYL